MSMDNPQAEGQVGPESVGASDLQPRNPGGPPPNTPSGNPSELRTEDALAKSDEELRRMAVARLAEHLDIGSSLITRCEELAQVHRGDRLGPLYAAARLMNANARVALALAQVGQVESRCRSIVERIQPPDPKTAELNSQLQQEEGGSECRLKVYRRMSELVDQSIRARTGETQEHDRIAELIKHELETLAGIKQQQRTAS